MLTVMTAKICNFDIFDFAQEFIDYDYYEEYDKNKQYKTDPFQHDFGKGIKTYQYELHRFHNKLDTDIKLFVVANEFIEEKENIFDNYYSLFCII